MTIEKQAIAIVAQLFDLAEVPLDKRQEINDVAYDYVTEQLPIHVVTFCLPEEGDDFEKWFFKHFFMNPDKTIVAIRNETIKYTQDQVLELWDFFTDRLAAN